MCYLDRWRPQRVCRYHPHHGAPLPAPADKGSPAALRGLVSFTVWSGVVSRRVEGGVELKRDEGSPGVVRPGLDDGDVSILQPGTRADLATGWLRFFGEGTRVTAVIVEHRSP